MSGGSERSEGVRVGSVIGSGMGIGLNSLLVHVKVYNCVSCVWSEGIRV